MAAKQRTASEMTGRRAEAKGRACRERAGRIAGSRAALVRGRDRWDEVGEALLALSDEDREALASRLDGRATGLFAESGDAAADWAHEQLRLAMLDLPPEAGSRAAVCDRAALSMNTLNQALSPAAPGRRLSLGAWWRMVAALPEGARRAMLGRVCARFGLRVVEEAGADLDRSPAAVQVCEIAEALGAVSARVLEAASEAGEGGAVMTDDERRALHEAAQSLLEQVVELVEATG